MSAIETILTEAPYKLSLLAEAIPHLLWVLDVEGRAIFFNQRWVTYTGCSLEAIKAWEDLLHPDDCNAARDAWDRCLAAFEPYDFEYRLRRVDGVYRWHLAHSLPVRDARGHKTMWIGTCTDIQRQKEAAERNAQTLAEAQARVQRLERSKNTFLANMAYEIQTPINGIMGITDVLLETHLDDQQLKFAKIIKHSGSNVLNLVNDIMDLAKIDTGKLVLSDAPLDILTLVRDQAEAVGFRAIDKHLSLMTYVDPAIPTNLVGDPVRLSQVILSLITYAIQITNTGLVSVCATLEARSGHAVKVRFSVEDTSMGLGPEMQARLFEPFMENEAPTSHKSAGTGLELPIAQRLVALMGGEIRVASQANLGTTFFFVVPLQLASQPEAPRPPMRLEGKRVMVVDDDLSAARVFLQYLQNAGARTMHCSVGTEACRQLRRVPHAFDAVVVDKRLPDMDGLDLVRQIKNDPKLAHLRLLLVSPLLDHVEREAWRGSGLAMCLARPVRKTDLVAAVANALQAPAMPA